MSAIGHYIHFSKKGYEEHGTTRSGVFNDPSISYRRQKKIMQHKIRTRFGEKKGITKKKLQNIA